MFTGIVRERGRVLAAEQNGGGVRLRIAAPETAAATSLGDSIAISGVCLTTVAVQDGELAFDAVPETLARTTLAGLAAGAEVIYQACFVDREWRGFADFVERQADGRYEVVDTKLARHSKPAYVLQLCF